MNSKKENIDEKIEKKLIEDRPIVDKIIDEKISEIIEEDAEKIVESSIRQRVDRKLQSQYKPAKSDTFSLVKNSIQMSIGPLSSCWRGKCKYLLISFAGIYLLVTVYLLWCSFRSSSYCLSSSRLLMAAFIIALIFFVVSLAISVTRKASGNFIISAILFVPLLLLILFVAFRTAAFLLVIIGVLLVILRIVNRE